MLSLRTTAAMERALCLPLDATLRSLLEQRMEQLRRNYEGDLADVVEFHVVELGDTQREIEAALGFPILRNLFDETTFGDPDFTGCWEWMLAHGRWFELLYLFTDDGFGTVVFVPNDPGVEFDLQAMCLEFTCCPPPPS
jgi:hypothetical protein